MPEENKAAEKTAKSEKKEQTGKLGKVLQWFKTLPTRIAKPFKNMYYELKKVSWPSKEALISYSKIVLAFMLVMGVVIGLLDMGASAAVRMLIPTSSSSAVVNTADEEADVEEAGEEAEEAAEEAADTAAEAADTAAEAVEDAAEAAEAKVEEAADTAKEAVEEAADTAEAKVEEAADTAKEAVEEVADAAEAKVEEAAEAVSAEEVTENTEEASGEN